MRNILQQINEAMTGNTPGQKLHLNEKAQVLEEIKSYQALGEVIYRSEGLKEAATKISKIVEKAEGLVLQETEEWFDEVTIKRNMKELNSKNQEFVKTVNEMAKLQQRLESLYEEMGNGLSRYYEIGN
jgi:hypothetical protein